MAYDPNQPRDSKGRWTNKAVGGAVGAALLAGLMTAAGGGGATASLGSALDTAASRSATESKGASNTKSKTRSRSTSKSRDAAKRGNETEAWKRMGLKKLRQEVKRILQCPAQSYGQVQEFFVEHPCDKLHQRLFPLEDGHGNVLAVSVMWVTMPSSDEAAELKKVEDVHGTGDVMPVGTQALGFGDFHFTGKHYESRRNGSLVVIAETEAVSGHPSEQLLDGVATVADVLPPP